MIIFESTELKSRKIKVNRIIKYVLGLYKELIVSRRAMLTHFLAVKQKDNLDADPLNVYVDICKSKGYEIERGLSAGETAFVFGAVKLKDQELTDVINAAFYNNTRNDTVFECGYLIEVFKKLIETDNARARIDYNVLCINPSPDMIIDLERDRSLRSRYHYSVVDDTLAQLYQIQFPTSVFVSFDRVSNLEGMDYILVTNRDYRKEKWMSLLQGLGVNSSEQAKVLMLVPSSWFDRFGSGIYDFIAEQGYCVQQILIIDSEATLSSPRKKLCVVLEKSSEQKTFILSKSRYNAKTRWFEVLEETLQIEIEEYFKTNVSIAKIWDMHLNPDQPIDNAPKYTKAKTYQYSKEIQITYRIYADRKNKYAGIVAYCKIEDVKLGTKGRQISKNIERGLRADTEEEVMEAFERIVFDKELYPIIRTDIDKNYVKANITLAVASQNRSATSLVPLENGKYTILDYDKRIPEIWESIISKCDRYTTVEVTDDERILFEVLDGYTWERLFSNARIDKIQIDAMIVAERERGVYLCDDLFFRKIATLKKIQNINFASLLYIHSDLDVVMPIVLELSKTNYVYVPFICRNNDECKQLVQNLLEGEKKKTYYTDFFNSYINVYDEIMRQYFGESQEEED